MIHWPFKLETERGTTAVGEASGIRERTPTEKVHYKEEQDDACWACGAVNSQWQHPQGCGHKIVWMDSHDKWKIHPARCTPVWEKPITDPE